MPRPRYRWSLPVGHTLLDMLVLLAWTWHATVLLKQEKGRLVLPQSVSPAYMQEGGVVEWNPRAVPPDPQFMLLLSGTLPAGLVSVYIRPEAGWQTRHKLWDPIWLLIHEVVAIPFWLFMGLWIDTGLPRLGRLMRVYLAARFSFAALFVGLGVAQFGASIQILFWLVLGCYGALRCLKWLVRAANSAVSG